MKTALITIALMALILVTLVVGCKKQEEAPTPSEPRKAAEGTFSEAANAVEAVKTTAKEATAQAATQLTAAQQQAQGLIDRAKSLLAENKCQDALASLNQLASIRLTPEQQKLVDELKAKIQAALAKTAVSGTNAASALGNMLGGKK